jgi:hypothetical protein
MTFPSLHLYAFDTLTILAISAECERGLSQCQEADYSGKEASGRGHHRGIRVLEELVGPWGNSATEVDEET